MVLQSIRDRLTGLLAIFILGVLVIPFAFVGVNSYFQTGSANFVARVNDRDITITDFTQSYSNYRRRMQSIMGAAFEPVQFESLVARREHLDSLIHEELLRQTATNINLDIDDERLGDEIRNIPAFQLDGKFNLDVYLGRLTSQGLSVSQFERDMRSQFIMSQLPTSLMASSITTRTELMDFVSLQDQTRNFRSILVTPLTDENAAPPSEEEILAYYEANHNSFQSAEMVEIEYLELNVLDISTGTEPDEEFLKSRFEQQKGRFLSPEQRQVSHVLIEVLASADEAVKETARQKAQDVADRARAGEDFAELAGEFSDDIGSADFGGDLGWMEPDVMSETFEEAMYALSLESPISDPIQTGFGWHVIQLRDIQPTSGMSFDEARVILVQESQQEDAEREFLDQADLLVDMIYEDPTTLDAAALDLGIDVQIAGPFSRAGGEGIAANADVVDAAFSELVLLQGSVSDPVELGDNHIVMVRAKEHFPVALRPLEDVRDEIVELIISTHALDAAKARADQLLTDLQGGELDLDGLAEQNGLEIIDSDAATRFSLVPDRTVITGIFQLGAPADGENISTVINADNGYALVVLSSVTPGSLETGAALNRQQYSRQIANAAASIEVTGLMRQLRETANVEVFEDNLQ